MALGLWNVETDSGPRLARGSVDAGPQELLANGTRLSVLLGDATPAQLHDLLNAPAAEPVPDRVRLAPPIPDELVWASGVTYERSRDARMEESDDLDFYDLVYEAKRPELFVKSASERVRGPGEAIAIRADSDWNVPEPELGVVANANSEVVGYVIGNDVSSRSIEGENPLYLPQAKTYDGACAIGPCLVPVLSAPDLDELIIQLQVYRDEALLFTDSVEVSRMRRTPAELVGWLFRAQVFPRGVVLLTGTGIVPGRDFTLQPADRVEISVNGLGTLRNHVELVGSADGEASAIERRDTGVHGSRGAQV